MIEHSGKATRRPFPESRSVTQVNRTKLKDRALPDYTRGEERMNMISHIAGGGLGVIALLLCVIRSALHHDPWAVVGSVIYGCSLILLYTMSSVYHGLRPPLAKKVMQVLDHCTIYILISGTYTPVLLCSIRRISPAWAWSLFGVVWGVSAVAIVFTAIDLHRFGKLSMACYLCLGWCVVLAVKPTLQAVPLAGLAWLLAGGISYSLGAVLYGLGKKHRYMHSVFHIFVVLGSILQFVCIYLYVI